MHGLELKVGDSGLYVRGKYWYDFELQDDSRPFKPSVTAVAGRRRSRPARNCWTPTSITTTRLAISRGRCV
jgi:hypothetical protein